MESFENNLMYYIQNSTDSCVLLNGAWGLGKTYYIQNSFPEVCKNRNIDMIYTSINGVDDVDKIERYILQKIIKSKSSFFTKTEELINFASDLEFYGLKSNKIYNSIIRNDKLLHKILDSNILIVIDDLERLSSKIDIENFLGFIHQKLIMNGFKVLFIGNEKYIKQQDEYLIIKEKYILHTVAFNPNFEKLLLDILNNRSYELSLKEFIMKYIAHINNIAFESNHQNIRTYIHFLELFKLPFNILNELEAEEYIIKSILSEILATLIEYKKGNFTSELKIDMFRNVSLYGLGTYKDNEYYKSILNTYKTTLDLKIEHTRSIENLVIKGLWDGEKFKKEIISRYSHSYYSNFKIKRSEKDIILNNILDYKKLEHDSLQAQFKTFLNIVKNGDYIFYRYPYLLSLAYTILDSGYGFFDTRYSINIQFTNGLRASIEKSYNPSLEEIQSTTTHLYNDNYSNDEVILNLINQIQNLRIENSLSNEELSRFSEYINNDITELNRLEIINTDRISLILSLASIENKSFFENLTNRGIYWLEVIFKNIFDHYYDFFSINDNVHYIKCIIEQINRVINLQSIDVMRKKRLEELNIILKRGISIDADS